MCFLAAHETLEWGISMEYPLYPHTHTTGPLSGVGLRCKPRRIHTHTIHHTPHHKTPHKNTPKNTSQNTPPKHHIWKHLPKTRVLRGVRDVCVTKSPKNLFLSRRKPRKTTKNTCFGGPKTHPKNPPKPQCGDRFIARLQVGWFLTPKMGGLPGNPRKHPKNPKKPLFWGGPKNTPKTPFFDPFWGVPKTPLFWGFWGFLGGLFNIQMTPVTVREPPCPRSETKKEKKFEV